MAVQQVVARTPRSFRVVRPARTSETVEAQAGQCMRGWRRGEQEGRSNHAMFAEASEDAQSVFAALMQMLCKLLAPVASGFEPTACERVAADMQQMFSTEHSTMVLDLFVHSAVQLCDTALARVVDKYAICVGDL